MADASCSGTTPYKQLIDHQSRDVSRHQDRLVDRSAGLAHGSFRSSPQPNHSQEEFGAFLDGSSSLPGMPQHMPQHAAGRLAIHAAALEPAHARPLPSSSASPHLNAAPQAIAPQGGPGLSNWAADFQRFSTQAHPQRRFQPQATPQVQTGHPHQLNFQAAFGQPNAGFSPLYGPTNGGITDLGGAATTQRPGVEADFDREMSRWMASHGGVGGGPVAANMKDVDAVMDQMARELEINEAALAAAVPETMTQEADFQVDDQSIIPGEGPSSDLEPPEMANLSLDARQELPTEPADSAAAKSAVSEAAEKLLETVQHEDGEKWKNSVFLSLMRDFRDGRKDIVDNEIREAADGDGGDDAGRSLT